MITAFSAYFATKTRGTKIRHRLAGTPTEQSERIPKPRPVPLQKQVDSSELALTIERMRAKFLLKKEVVKLCKKEPPSN